MSNSEPRAKRLCIKPKRYLDIYEVGGEFVDSDEAVTPFGMRGRRSRTVGEEDFSGLEDTPTKTDFDKRYSSRNGVTLIGSEQWLDDHGYSRLDEVTTLTDKFEIDAKFYGEHKKRFERDVYRFLWHHGKTMSKPPRWHGVHLNLFQLYMAVYNLGGFDQISFDKRWLQLYRELFGLASRKVQTAHGLKTYYCRNILAYERYVMGENWQRALEEANSKRRKYRRFDSDSDESDDEYRAGRDRVSSMVECPQEMMCELLVQASQASAYDILKEQVEKESSKMDLNVMFYDDTVTYYSAAIPSPQYIEANTASEFGQADEPVESSCGQSDGISTSSDICIIHELQALSKSPTPSEEDDDEFGQAELEAIAKELQNAEGDDDSLDDELNTYISGHDVGLQFADL